MDNKKIITKQDFNSKHATKVLGIINKNSIIPTEQIDNIYVSTANAGVFNGLVFTNEKIIVVYQNKTTAEYNLNDVETLKCSKLQIDVVKDNKQYPTKALATKDDVTQLLTLIGKNTVDNSSATQPTSTNNATDKSNTDTSTSKKSTSTIVKIIVGVIVIGVLFSMCSSDDEVADVSITEDAEKDTENNVEENTTSTETVESEYNMSMFTEIPMADDFDKAKKDARSDALSYFANKTNNKSNEIIEEVLIDASESSSKINVIINIDKNHNLINGEVDTFRNIAVDLVQDYGLVREDDYMRTVNVAFAQGLSSNKYTFTYGEGWNE